MKCPRSMREGALAGDAQSTKAPAMENTQQTALTKMSPVPADDHLIRQSKTYLIDALDAAGVDTVTVRYNGDSGEGTISLVQALGAATLQGEAAQTLVDLRAVPHFNGDRRADTLHTLVVVFAWNLIGHFYPGSLDDYGAEGVVTIDVRAGTVGLKHASRRVVCDYFDVEV